MSNEFVMVPRELLERYVSSVEGHGYGFDGDEEIRTLLDKPTMHQGEPVALPARLPAHRVDSHGWNACLDEIAKLGPLYTRPVQGEPVAWLFESPEGLEPVSGFTRDPITAKRFKDAGWAVEQVHTNADPGEVERLAILLRQTQVKHSQERDTLRAQLTERGALLREIKNARDWNGSYRALERRINAALSASAEPSERERQALEDEKRLGIERFPVEPSAPVDIDERAAFEKEFAAKGRPLTRADYDPDAYGNAFDDGAWTGWQARAALGRKP